MLFHIFIAIIALCLSYFIFEVLFPKVEDFKLYDYYTGLFIISLIFSAPFFLSVVICWTSHAGNLSKISHQQALVAVYEENINELSKRLDEFNYPAASLMNSDTPVASITQSLTEAQAKLSQIKEEKAYAIRSVEKTRLGVMSGVIWWVGDYK